jgi:hypothetical protein
MMNWLWRLLGENGGPFLALSAFPFVAGAELTNYLPSGRTRDERTKR